MNDLNTQQIVLLTLLVSFVTSIATGITTVSLLEQAPEPITQTINRVVEKTVERVVEIKEENNQPVERVVETVIVNAEDLAIQAISKNTDSVVRIYNKIGESKFFVGIGIVISNTGDILIDSKNILQNNEYSGIFVSGEKDLTVAFREANNPYSVLKIKESTGEKFSPAIFGDSQNIRLGQSIISLSGQNSNFVSNGIVTSLELIDAPADSQNTNKILRYIDTSVDGSRMLNGSILLNLKGEIVGAQMNIDSGKNTLFTPSKNLREFISNFNSAGSSVSMSLVE